MTVLAHAGSALADQFKRSLPLFGAMLVSIIMVLIGLPWLISWALGMVWYFGLRLDKPGLARSRPDHGDSQIASFNALVERAEHTFWDEHGFLYLSTPRHAAMHAVEATYENDLVQCLIGAVRCGFVPVQDWRHGSSALRYIWDTTAIAVEQALLQDRRIRREAKRRQQVARKHAAEAFPL